MRRKALVQPIRRAASASTSESTKSYVYSVGYRRGSLRIGHCGWIGIAKLTTCWVFKMFDAKNPRGLSCLEEFFDSSPRSDLSKSALSEAQISLKIEGRFSCRYFLSASRTSKLDVQSTSPRSKDFRGTSLLPSAGIPISLVSCRQRSHAVCRSGLAARFRNFSWSAASADLMPANPHQFRRWIPSSLQFVDVIVTWESESVMLARVKETRRKEVLGTLSKRDVSRSRKRTTRGYWTDILFVNTDLVYDDKWDRK